MATSTFPSWRYGPADQAEIFETADAVPEGWEDHPEKVKVHPLDHDGDGKPGGTKPRVKAG